MDYRTLFTVIAHKPAEHQAITEYIRAKADLFQSTDLYKVMVGLLEYERQFQHLPDPVNMESYIGGCTPIPDIETAYGSIDKAYRVLWENFRREVAGRDANTALNTLTIEQDTAKKLKLANQYVQYLTMASGNDQREDTTARSTKLTFKKKSDNNDIGIQHPIREWNELYGPLLPGMSMVILGGVGGFKTTMALNYAYLNSIAGSKNGGYLYMEDSVEGYQARLLGRHSYAVGQNIESESFRSGAPDDATVDVLNQFQERYANDMKGELFFMSPSQFSHEPYSMAVQIASYVEERDIRYLVVDYAQRIQAYRTSGYSDREYVNAVLTALSTSALGGYDNKPFALIILSQFTKDGLRRLRKSRGRASIADGADLSVLERDAFLFTSLYSDDAMRSAGELSWQVLKARYGEPKEDPQTTGMAPEFSFVGDVVGGQSSDVYDPQAVAGDADSDLWGGFDA